jgi:hypothetical protein
MQVRSQANVLGHTTPLKSLLGARWGILNQFYSLGLWLMAEAHEIAVLDPCSAAYYLSDLVVEFGSAYLFIN